MKCGIGHLMTVVLIVGGAMHQAVAQSETSNKPAQAGTVSGRIVDSVTGVPVSKAALRLLAMTAGGPNRQATSDGQGNFAFANVDPGSYRLTAERSGYLTHGYGMRWMSQTDTPIVVSPGQETAALVFKLTPEGSLSGRVFDPDGEAVSGCMVNILRETVDAGVRRLELLDSTQTDDAGRFRFGRLTPGRYSISASPSTAELKRLASSSSGGETEERLATTYFPNSTDPAGAAPIDVAAGQEQIGSDIRLQNSRVYRITGRVQFDSPDSANRPIAVTLFRPPESGILAPIGAVSRYVKAEKRFDIGGVPSGRYVLAAVASNVVVARQPLDAVGGSGLIEATLAVHEPLNLIGAISVADHDPIDLSPVRLALIPTTAERFAPQPPKISPDGHFTITGIGMDLYRLKVTNLPEGTFIRSARVGETDILDKGLDLTSASAPGALSIVFSTRAAEIHGSVRDGSQQSAPGAVVALIPVSENTADLNRRQRVIASPAGDFRFANVAPGKYKVCAWGDLEPGAETDKATFSACKASDVDAGEGASIQVQVEVSEAPR